MTQETTSPQGLKANQELKAAFRDEVKAVEAILIEHNLIEDFTPAGEYIRPQNVSFAAPAIVIARLLSGYWVGSAKYIFDYALDALQHNTRIEAFDIQIPKEQEEAKDA